MRLDVPSPCLMGGMLCHYPSILAQHWETSQRKAPLSQDLIPCVTAATLLPDTFSHSLPKLSRSSPAGPMSLLLASSSVLPWLPTSSLGLIDFSPKPHKLFVGADQGQCSILLENTLAMSNPHCRACIVSRNRDLSPLSHPPLPN